VNIFPRPCQWSISFWIFRPKCCTHTFRPWLKPRLTRLPCVETNNIRWRIQIKKLFIMQFSETPVTPFFSAYKIPLLPYSQTLSFKVVSSYERSSSTAISNISLNYNFVYFNHFGFFGGKGILWRKVLNWIVACNLRIPSALYLANTVFFKIALISSLLQGSPKIYTFQHTKHELT
jgi:hypothetical protein